MIYAKKMYFFVIFERATYAEVNMQVYKWRVWFFHLVHWIQTNICNRKEENRQVDLVKYYKFFVSTKNKNRIISNSIVLLDSLDVNHDYVLRVGWGFPTYTLSEYVRMKSTWIKCIYMQFERTI